MLWSKEISFTLAGYQTLAVQSVSRRYTDKAIPDHKINILLFLAERNDTTFQINSGTLNTVIQNGFLRSVFNM
jgi:hypothetical protein